ncbi:zinc-binding dehydrogenase [Citricoccus sp. NPDC055426]|uniref:zinc-binding dehydrogenase n=1 Tax=Citricoccus sp. NPDC055426 TaxID=3155536 RepID=UPI00342C713F
MTTAARIVVQENVGEPFEIVDVELPDPSGHEVLVRIKSTGVCQSQIFWSTQPHAEPMLFGHEALGVVDSVGANVTWVTPGQAVLVTWIPRDDERVPEIGTVVLPDGRTATAPNIYTWGTHVIVDELYVVAVNDSADRDVSAVVACAVLTGAGAVKRTAAIESGSTVAVIGLGGVGLSAVVAAREVGASQVIAVDLSDEKLEFAERFGATTGINGRTEDVVARILELTGGVDYVIDCVTNDHTVEQGLSSLRKGKVGVNRGGSHVLVGIPEKPLTISTRPMLLGEFDLIGTLGGSSLQADVHEYLDWAAGGTLDLETMITNRYTFEDVVEAMDDLNSGKVLGRSILVLDD